MSQEKKFIKILIPIVLFLFFLGIRMFFSMQCPYLSNESYNHLENAQNFNFSTTNFVFYSILSLILALTKNVLFLKLFANLFFALASVMVYFIAVRISKSRFFSVISALTAGFLPIYFSQTFNSLAPFSLGLFLLFFNIYAYLNSDKKSWILIYLLSFILFSFTHWLVILYIAGLAVYHLIFKLENIRQKTAQLELFLFSVFFGVWAQILIYKKTLLLHGLNILTLNIPNILRQDYFPPYSLSIIMTFLGIIPLIAGLYIIYKYSFEKKGKEITLIISFIALIAVLFWLKLCFTYVALILMGLFFCILLAKWFFDFKIFIKQTKSAKFVNIIIFFYILTLILVVIPATLFYTNLNFDSAPHQAQINALRWLKQDTPEDAIILSLPEEGSLINYFADRKTVMTTDFFNIPDAEERLNDIYRIYKTSFATEAVELLNKYGASYLLFSEKVKKEFNIDKLAYVDSKCFRIVSQSDYDIIYEKNPECRLKVVS